MNKVEIDHESVWINFSKPFNDLTKRRTLVTLKTLKTVIICELFKNEASIPSILVNIKSTMEAKTTKKLNWFYPK